VRGGQMRVWLLGSQVEGRALSQVTPPQHHWSQNLAMKIPQF
jgi:hypothetical protein